MLAGCGQSTAPSDKVQGSSAAAVVPTPAAQASPTAQVSPTAQAATKPIGADPVETVREFLDGIRQGNDKKVSQMMTKLACEKIGQQGLQVAPQGSDTAKFEIGKVEYVGDNGARVAATWTDFDADRQPKTDNMLWVVRKDPEGWRVLGMAAEVFPGEPPLLLNFEQPEETKKKLQWLQEEVRRRAGGAENLQAQQRENSPQSIQR